MSIFVGFCFEPSSTTSSIEIQHTRKHKMLPKELVLPYLVILRCINALTIHTFFQADEYWQSLEPAHHLVFGYGYLTWEWREGLRSFVHPLIFSLVYQLSELLGLGDVGVIYLPKITQGVITAIGEWYLYVFALKLTNSEMVARGTLLLSVISAFNWAIATRTFSNSLELTLSTVALSHWCWHTVNWEELSTALWFAAWSCFIRPTNGLIWMVLGANLLMKLPWRSKMKFVLLCAIVGSLVGVMNGAIDYWYYGEIVFPAWRFIKFNGLASLSRFYGVAPWHFHIFQSVPLMLMLYTPFFLYGTTKIPYTQLNVVLLFVVTTFSCIDHKEFRFLLPLQPIMLLITSYGAYHLHLHRDIKWTLYIIIFFNTAVSIFLTQWHERGVIDVIDYLRDDPDVFSVGFLMPCHSTPWQSHLHRNIDSWFLTCEPPLHLADESKHMIDEYMDESDLFYKDPKTFLRLHFPPVFDKKLRQPGREFTYEWPTHLVFFEQLEPDMVEFLKESPYQECQRFFNSYFHWDSRREGDVIVYCKWPWE